jgi:hypothetical protein
MMLGQWLEIKKFGIHDIALLVQRKRWTGNVEEDEKIMGIRHWHTGPETSRNWGGLHWKPRYTTWPYCLRRSRRKWTTTTTCKDNMIYTVILYFVVLNLVFVLMHFCQLQCFISKNILIFVKGFSSSSLEWHEF